MQNKQKQIPKRHNSSRIRQIQNMFQYKTKQIKWKINLLQDRLEQFKKRRSLFQNGLQQIAKMQNLSQNELDQIAKMQNQPKQIVKMRRIKNCENTSTEGLLIALLKSEQSLDKPYNEVEETKKYLDHDEPNYEGIRSILFDEINADYYKPVRNALKMFLVPHNTKVIELAYNSKYNHNRKSQAVLLMITNGKKWHYFAVKSLSALLRAISSSHVEDYYCLGCFHSKSTDNEFKKHERLCGKHDYCQIAMSKEDEKILIYNHGEKSLKAPFIIYADLECLLKRKQSCQNNPEKLNTEKKAEHEPSCYSLSLICSFDETNDRDYFYRGKDCIENFCKKLKELGAEIINYREKEVMPLTDGENKTYEKQKICHISKKKFWYK